MQNPMGMEQAILSKKMFRKRKNLQKNQFGAICYLLRDLVKNPSNSWKGREKFEKLLHEGKQAMPPPPTPANAKVKRAKVTLVS
jgi:hypothetical protein